VCLAVPGRIIEISGEMALVDVQGNRTRISCVLTPDARPNDWVLVHAGFAISQLDERLARETWDFLDSSGRDSAADVEGHRGF